ncbi:hypothetical protein BDY21DRAFT_377589 [Lineolata rhizophorae]|uniref:Sm domain-containing protein n=1 Tax=Lineolata rhizophorae TaxID=578093 RepID=A0A6A6P850_9PEZI|nr:hypothetical protein BDY21DRAFT_377589 [Lineolata rhizophorae]
MADYCKSVKAQISRQSSTWRKKKIDPDFDELYDVTDDESEEVPLKCSASAHPDNGSKSRFPSLVIPSPSAWPTIEKLQKAQNAAISPACAPAVSPSARALSMLAAQQLHVPATSATPSLDGSLTSEDLSSISCPSTPDLEKRNQDAEAERWDGTIQLHPNAMMTLNHLNSHEEHPSNEQQEAEIPQMEMQEVRQVQRALAPIDIVVTPVDKADECDDPISALSVPSPGGFFSSLEGSAKDMWGDKQKDEEDPDTGTAEHFYGLPWKRESSASQVSSEWQGSTNAPTLVQEVAEIDLSNVKYEYDENYDNQLQEMATANIDRTSLWLRAQESYLSALKETNPLNELTSPTSIHSRDRSLEDTICSPSKKSVRFTDDTKSSSSGDDEDEKIKTFLEGVEYMKENARSRDAFVHRQTRVDAISIDRRCFPQAHRNQLLGKYEITKRTRPSISSRPVSSFYNEDPTAHRQMIEKAEKEREALDQMLPALWGLEAIRYLNKGRLLASPAARNMVRRGHVKILDLGGQAACDWAWQVALDHPNTTVVTATTADKDQSIEGPSNHRVSCVPNYWTLPFPNNHFDVVSARSLFTQLRSATTGAGRVGGDEYDRCLRECMRVLRPGGVLEFSVLDADLVNGGPQATALSVEFAFNLKTAGYDARPTKTFVSRLRRAGFANVKRAWLALPVAQPAVMQGGQRLQPQERSISPEGEVRTTPMGSTADASSITGLMAARAWEKWMLKLQLEMRKEDERLLEGVSAALEEGAKTGAAWKYLTGWARNFFKTLVDYQVTVELKNDISIQGTLKSVDQFLNIKLDNISVVEESKYPHLSSVKNVFIRGSVVRYVHLPAEKVDTVLLEDATRREAQQASAKAKQS